MKSSLKFLFGLGLLIFLAFCILLFAPTLRSAKGNYLYIKNGSTYNDVYSDLQTQKIIPFIKLFDVAAKILKYPQHVKSGRYEVKRGESLYGLIKKLRNGTQSPVKIVINKIRTPEDFAGFIGKRLDFDSLQLLNIISNNDSLQQYGLNTNNFMTCIIPDTYNFYWNISPETFIKKMQQFENKFWTDERKEKAAQLRLTTDKVYTLASIIEEETNYNPEKPLMASVYINRLNTGTKLQADPTVKYAMKDFALRRILNVHLQYESPYNTYLNVGLPPGPICTPSKTTIDAVLNAPETDYMFFVVNFEKPGTHSFSATYAEHKQKANEYHNLLNAEGR